MPKFQVFKVFQVEWERCYSHGFEARAHKVTTQTCPKIAKRSGLFSYNFRAAYTYRNIEIYKKTLLKNTKIIRIQICFILKTAHNKYKYSILHYLESCIVYCNAEF